MSRVLANGHVYFSAIFIHIGIDMYNSYTYPSEHVYFLAVFLYISAFICIICIHIHPDMYTFRRFLYISALTCIIRIHIHPIFGIRHPRTITRTVLVGFDALPDESDPRFLRAQYGYSLRRCAQNLHPERRKPQPHLEVSLQSP